MLNPKACYHRCFRLRANAVLLSTLFIVQPLTALATENAALFGNATSLTSATLLNAVLSHNADLPAARAQWQATKNRITQAKSLDDPKISYHFAPQSVNVNGLDFGQKISLSQRLPWPGKLDLQGEIARAKADGALASIEELRLKLTEAAKHAYAEWYFIHAAIRINSLNKTLLQEFHHIAEIKYSAGRASQQDVLRAEIEQVSLQHRSVVLERQRRDLLANINALLQRLPDQFVPPPASLNTLPPLPSMQQLRERLLKQHPELRILTLQIQANRHKEKLTKLNDYPDINLNAGYNSLWKQDEKRFTIGLSINLPLSNKRDAKKAEIRALQQQLKARQRSKKSHLMADLQQVFEKVRESEHLLKLYKNRLLPLLETNLKTTQFDYEAGNGNFLDLIRAEKELIKTQLQRERTLSDYHRHRTTLERLVGSSLRVKARSHNS